MCVFVINTLYRYIGLSVSIIDYVYYQLVLCVSYGYIMLLHRPVCLLEIRTAPYPRGDRIV